jgi:hypothetical protein
MTGNNDLIIAIKSALVDSRDDFTADCSTGKNYHLCEKAIKKKLIDFLTCPDAKLSKTHRELKMQTLYNSSVATFAVKSSKSKPANVVQKKANVKNTGKKETKKQPEVKQEEVKQEEVKQEEVKQEEVKQEEVKQENNDQDEIKINDDQVVNALETNKIEADDLEIKRERSYQDFLKLSRNEQYQDRYLLVDSESKTVWDADTESEALEMAVNLKPHYYCGYVDTLSDSKVSKSELVLEPIEKRRTRTVDIIEQLSRTIKGSDNDILSDDVLKIIEQLLLNSSQS